MKEISKWQKGDLEVRLLADGLNTDTFTLQSNFPMWKVDDVGYSLQTLYNSACSACVQEDVYDENTNEYLYSRDVEPPEVDYWYNPFKSYRYNYPYKKFSYIGGELVGETRTSIWADGFDKVGAGEKPMRAKRFNMGKQFTLGYNPKNARLQYQLNREASKWAYNSTKGTCIPPNLNACLTNDTITYKYDDTHKNLAIRFFECKNGSLLEYMLNMLPIETDSVNAKRLPIRFYDSYTGDLYYLNGTIHSDGRILNSDQYPLVTSFDQLKQLVKKDRETRYYDGMPVVWTSEFFLEGIYKANNLDRKLSDVCTEHYIADLNKIGSWTEIIDHIIKDNNLDASFIMDSRLVMRHTMMSPTYRWATSHDYEILDSLYISVDTSTHEGTNLPVDDPVKLEKILSHGIRVITEDVVYTPSFIINEKLSVGFPIQLCYTTDPNGVRSCEIENYGWDEKRQGITFDVVIKSTMLNDSIALNLGKNQLVVDGWDEGQLNPPNRIAQTTDPHIGYIAAPIRFYDFQDDFALGHPNTVSGDNTWEYLGMYTDAAEKYNTNSAVSYGPINLTTEYLVRYDNMQVHNSIPMQANGQIKFVIARTYHCFVPTMTLDDELIITGDFIKGDIRKRVSFANYIADVFYEKLLNNVDVELPGGVILKAYMYDATKICIKDDLGTAFNLDKSMVFINEVLPNGKICEFALNETPSDFVFIEPFQYNPSTGYDEVILYISAKNTEGYGFNDASVNFTIELPEEIRKKYNLETTSWNIGFRTYLPPFMIQGIPKKVVTSAIDPVIPGNYSRVNYPAYSYQQSRMGWTENYLFTNGDPLYHVIASGFIPEQLMDFEFSNVSSYIHDNSTNMKTFLDYDVSSSLKTLPTLISGHNEFSTTTSEIAYQGNFKIWEYDQMIESEALKNRKSWTKNSVNISARCEYDLIPAVDSLSKHTVRIAEETTNGILIEGDISHVKPHKVTQVNGNIVVADA